MTWTKVLAEADLPAETRQVVKLEKRQILLINHQGKLYALDNACPHLKLPLKKGEITEAGAIVCPWHRSAFDLATGEVQQWCTWPPVVGNVMGAIAQEKPLSVFPVRLEEGNIWIDL